MTTIEWLTLALVAITAFYAYATHKILQANEAMVEAMRGQQDAAMRPYILVSSRVRTGTNLLYLSIKNVGKTAALDLRLSLDKDFVQLGKENGRSIGRSAAFTQKIDSLPPEGQFLYLLGTAPSLYGGSRDESRTPLVFSVTAAYAGPSSKFHETSVVDLRPYINTDIPTDPIAEKLESLNESLGKVVNALSRR